MQIPTIVKSQEGIVFFLQYSKFAHQYDASSSPIFGEIPTLSWHDGYDLSFDYESVMNEVIVTGEFELVRTESVKDFKNGSQVAYFDFCYWVDELTDAISFNSSDSLFSCFTRDLKIDLTDNYEHPSWLTDIFHALYSEFVKNKIVTKEQIKMVIGQTRASYYPPF